MATPSPTPMPRDTAARPPARRAWPRAALWAALAFAIGLLVSLVLVLRGRDDDAFFRAGPAPVADEASAPLPAPMAGDAPDASGMDFSRPPPRDPEPQPAPRRAPEPVAAAPRPEPAPAVGASTPARPLPGATPAPRYPVSALRRGEGGEVLVRAEVGPDGVVTSVSLARPSGNRALDRAALDAVRRWRFEPARRDGVPTVDSVQVPIRFSAE